MSRGLAREAAVAPMLGRVPAPGTCAAPFQFASWRCQLPSTSRESDPLVKAYRFLAARRISACLNS